MRIPREKVILQLRYKRGAPADRQQVFRDWRDSERIDVVDCGEVEMRGKRYAKTTVAFYCEVKS